MASRKSSTPSSSILKRLENVSTTPSKDNDSVDKTPRSLTALSRQTTSPAAGGGGTSHRPSTNLGSPTLLSILSRKDGENSMSRKPQAPALKVRQTSPSVTAGGSGSSRRPSRFSTDSAATAPDTTTTSRNTHPYLIDKWFQDVETVNTMRPVNGIDHRPWWNPPARNPPPHQGDDMMMTRKLTPLSKTTMLRSNSKTKYDQSFLPFHLRDLHASAEPDDLFDDEYYQDDYDLVPPNPWKSSRLIVCDPPPPPPRLSNGLVLSTPTKLEMLGPLRSSSSRSSASSRLLSSRRGDNDDDTAILPYATVATRGPRPMTPRSKIPPAFDPAAVSAKKTTQSIDVDYEKLIRHTTKNKNNAALADKYLRDWTVDFHAIGGKAPNGVCYNLVLKAHASTGDAEKAEEVLKLMWKDHEAGNDEALPNRKIYTTVMYAWQNSKNKYYAPERCEQLLVEMNRCFESGKAPGCKPDVFAYTCCLHCWAGSNRGEVAVARSEALFDQMMASCNSGDVDFSPDNVAYSNLINCYINADSSTDFSMIQRAETKFWEMVDQYHNGNHKAAPSTRNFNTILAALSHSNSKMAAMHANNMISKWESLVRNGHVTTEPDAYSYSLWLKCWAISPRKDSMEHLENAMRHLKHAETANVGARLDVIKYTTAIQAFARHNKVYNAHEYLLEMASRLQRGDQACKVDVKLFCTVLSAWTRFSHACVAVDKATTLINRLWELHQIDARLKPNVHAYNPLLISCKNANDPRQALRFLQEMKDFSAAKLMEGPSIDSYSHVLEAWACSDDPCKKAKIRQLKQECMTRFGSVPSFNY